MAFDLGTGQNLNTAGKAGAVVDTGEFDNGSSRKYQGNDGKMYDSMDARDAANAKLAGGGSDVTDPNLKSGVIDPSLKSDDGQVWANATDAAAQNAKLRGTVYKIPLTSTGDSAGTVVTSPSTGSTTIIKDDKTTQTTGGDGTGFQVPLDSTGYTPGTVVTGGDSTVVIGSDGTPGANGGGKTDAGANPEGYKPSTITPEDIAPDTTSDGGGKKPPTSDKPNTSDTPESNPTPKINATYNDRAGAQPTWQDPAAYARQGGAMQSAAEASYGGSAAEALRRAMGASQEFAGSQADRAAANAGRQSTAYARASGLSPAQAALMAGQQSGDRYNDAYSQALNTGLGQYSTLAGQMANLGTAQEGLGLQKYGLDVNQNTAKNQNATQQWQSLLGADTSRYGIDVGADTSRYGIDRGIGQQQQQNNDNFLGSLLSGGASILGGLLLSDETAKEDIKDGYGILEKVTKTVGPKTFKYKSGVGEDSNKERVGVMAQDLEKTPLASVVQTGQDGLKRVDTGQLSLGNTAMISELSKKVDTLAKFLKGAQYA